MQMLAVSRLMNQAVGDALSGLLLCEAVLRSGTSLADWQGLYQDLPSRQLKLVVADRTAITTTDAERICVTPAGMHLSSLVVQPLEVVSLHGLQDLPPPSIKCVGDQELTRKVC